MQAAVLYEAKQPLVVEDVDLDSPGPGEVKIRLGATAICHSDIHFFDGDVPMRSAGIAGHECAGIVEEVGADVTSVKRGDHVVMAPITGGCGRCMNCMVGLRHLCQGVTRSGPHHRNKRGEPLAPLAGPVGGLAEYTIVHEFQTAKVPDDLPMHVACLLGCGVLTGFGAVVNRAQVKPFQSVAVIGTGGVGLNAIQGAAFSGAHPVIAVDLLDNKLEAARKFGATHTVNASQGDPVQGVKNLTGGRGVDFSFIMAASSKAVRQAFEMLGPRGTAVMVQITSGDMSDFAPREFIGERMFTGSMLGSTRLQLDVPRYVDIYKAGRLKLDELVTECYSLDRVNEAVASSKSGAALRNVIVF
ncbi:MAG: Zn-dependent alcohol dehydrogenase [Chloroflexi bacterium]|nr:Zn-dependent alcohol dehydrogenase [Chloroflexota bacterium]MBV9894657.1 Zn-dependent alcohol dehydrogenase [Chloroflexota bacterium]